MRPGFRTCCYGDKIPRECAKVMFTHALYSPDLSAQLCGCWQESQSRHRWVLGGHSVLWREPQGCLFFFRLPHIQMFCCCVFDAESHSVANIALELCNPGRPQTEQSCPSLLSARIVGMSHCAHLWSRNLSFCLFVCFFSVPWTGSLVLQAALLLDNVTEIVLHWDYGRCLQAWLH